MSRAPRELALGTLAGVVSVALLLGVVEAAFRIVDFPLRATWEPSENALARFDPELGWSYRPDRSVTQEFGPERTPVAMHFDSSGARVRAPGVRHDPHRPTLLLVGDSFTMGHGIAYEETVAGHLEATAGFPLQVVNLGVQGYGTDQTLLLLEREIGRFDTRAVVYTFLWDHVYRNANHDRRLLQPRARFLGTKPRFALGPDGTLRLRDRPERYEDRLICRLCELVQLAWARYGPPPSLELTRALMRRMRDSVESRGAVFVVVRWSWGRTPAGTRFALFSDPGLHVLDTGRDAPRGWDTWRVGGHPAGRANARVAKLLHQELRSLRVVPP